MNNSQERRSVECVCSQTGNTWHAIIEKRGEVWVFVGHYLPDQYRKFKQETERETHRQRILQQMNALNEGRGSVLPPPPQVNIVPEFQEDSLNINSVSEFGFQCPYCKESSALRCLVCAGISCLGEVDSSRRTICVRCGSTLQFSDSPTRTGANGAPSVLKA